MRQHRFLLVFGPEAGGSILFFKRIVRFSAIAKNWDKVAYMDFQRLGQRSIADSPPVPSPVGAVNERLCSGLFRDLLASCRKGTRSPAATSLGLTRKMREAGLRWTVSAGIYWNEDRRSVDPPSDFFSFLTVWPQERISRREETRLKREGFYDRVAGSLRSLGYSGRWLKSPWGLFGDFTRYRLCWKDVPSLCDQLQGWTLSEAIEP
jgi:hypothetical protein